MQAGNIPSHFSSVLKIVKVRKKEKFFKVRWNKVCFIFQKQKQIFDTFYIFYILSLVNVIIHFIKEVEEKMSY